MKCPKVLKKNIDYKKVKDPVFKYELLRGKVLLTKLTGQYVDTEYFTLFKDGRLLIKKGYRWDGPSGPTIDTPSSMRGSLFHDALWQLIEEGYLAEVHRHYTNRVFRDICIEDGMWYFRAQAFYYSVDYVGRPYIKAKKWFYGR